MDKPWRMVEMVCGATVGLDDGPRTPIGLKIGEGNRGRPGPPAWGWRGSDGVFHWEDGLAPAKVGVVCSDDWRPIPASDLGTLLPPLGGFPWAQVRRQKKAHLAVKLSDLKNLAAELAE